MQLSIVIPAYNEKATIRQFHDAVQAVANRFGFEPDITAKIDKINLRIYEVGISYAGRTYQ